EDASHGERHIKVGVTEDHHSWEGLRGHTDDGELLAVQANCSAQNRRIAARLVAPELRAEHEHGVATRDLVFVRGKAAAHMRLDAEYAKVICRDKHAAFDAWRDAGIRGEANSFELRVGDHAVVAVRFVAKVEIFATREIFEAAVVCGPDQRDNVARTGNGI